MNASMMSLLWFAVIVAMIPVALWLVKRSPMGASLGMPGAAAPVRSVASLAVGPQQRVVTVEVGEGDERRRLVLGVTGQQITLLHTLSAPPADPAAPAAPAVQGFAQLLAGLRGQRPEDRDAR